MKKIIAIIFSILIVFLLLTKLNIIGNIGKLGADVTTKTATLKSAPYFLNEKMKKLAGASTSSTLTEDTKTKYFKRSNTIENKYKTSDYIVSEDDSENPVYMWFDSDTLYYYTQATKIYLNKNSSWMFSNFKSLVSLDLRDFDTSNVTDMDNMFYGCSSLKSINLSSFDTKNVTDMSGMFVNCSSLTNLNLSNFNTSNTTNLWAMFGWCKSLTSLDLSNFNTSKVTNMSQMFAGCNDLKSINLSSFNTKNVTQMDSMFSDCNSLSSIDLSNFNTSNVTNMSSMFRLCESLTSLDLSNFDTSNVTNMNGMFQKCSNLVNLNLSNFNTSKVTDFSNIFDTCSKLETIKIRGFDISSSNYAAFIANINEKLKVVTVTFDKNDGSNENKKQVFVSGSDISKFFDVKWEKLGYTIRWDEDKNGSGTYSYTSSVTENWVIKNATSITLYAIYVPNKYNISYDLNGGTHTESYPGEAEYDKTFTVSNPSKTGHVFSGWDISGMDNTLHKYGSKETNETTLTKVKQTTYKNLRSTSGTVKFKANYEELTATLTYDSNGHGTIDTTVIMKYTSSTKAASAITAQGYTFKKWCTKSNGEGVCYNAGSTVKKENVVPVDTTLYAIWEPIEYTIKYELDKGSIEVNKPEKANYDQMITIDNPAKTLTVKIKNEVEGATVDTKDINSDYNFAGWDISGMDNTLHKYGSKETNETNLSGIKQTTYTNLRASTGEVVFSAKFKSPTVTLPKVTKKGYVCSFVSSNREFASNSEYTPASTGGEKTREFTVKCEPATYTITFDGNGNTSGKMNNQTCTYDSECKLNKNEFIKLGYTFTGWSSTLNGKIEYTDMQNVKNLDSILYAVWEPIKYTIRYELDKGNYGESHPETANYDQMIIINNPAKTLTVKIKNEVEGATVDTKDIKENYTFTGWNISEMDNTLHKYGSKETNETNLSGIKQTTYTNLRASTGEVVFSAKFKSPTVTLPKVTKEGYTCFYTTANRKFASNSQYTPASTGGEKTREFTVECKKNEDNVDSLIQSKLKMKEGMIVLNENDTLNRIIEIIENNEIKVLDNNTEVSVNNIIKTGNKLKTSSKEYIMIIQGDVNSDGRVTGTDVAKAYSMYNKRITYTNLEKLAADANEDGNVTGSDVAKLYNMYTRKENVQ